MSYYFAASYNKLILCSRLFLVPYLEIHFYEHFYNPSLCDILAALPFPLMVGHVTPPSARADHSSCNREARLGPMAGLPTDP